jgi:hypothetical protein
MDVEEIEWEVVDWIYLAPEKGCLQPPMKMIMKLQVP